MADDENDGGGRSYTINADGVTEFPCGRRAAASLDAASLPPHAGHYPGHVDRSVASMIGTPTPLPHVACSAKDASGS